MADIKGTVDADTIVGTNLQDLIQSGEGADTVDAGDDDDKVYGGKGNDVLADGAGHDYVSGDSGEDLLVDGAGNDTLSGGSDNDRVVAGVGDDAYIGGSGFDTVDFSLAAAGVKVDLSKGTAIGADTGADSLQGFESFIGTDFADTVKGSKAADTIDGGAGDDVIRGLGGADILSGGGGRDTFVWKWSDVVDAVTETHLGVDVITDFSVGDRLDISALMAGQTYENVGEVLRVANINGGAQVSILDGDAFVAVAFVENTTAGMLGDGGLLY